MGKGRGKKYAGAASASVAAVGQSGQGGATLASIQATLDKLTGDVANLTGNVANLTGNMANLIVASRNDIPGYSPSTHEGSHRELRVR